MGPFLVWVGLTELGPQVRGEGQGDCALQRERSGLCFSTLAAPAEGGLGAHLYEVGGASDWEPNHVLHSDHLGGF